MIDEISLKILKILQEKARIPNVEVARQVGMAPSAVLERIRKLEKQGIIDGYEVRLNPERFNRNLVAFVFVRTEKKLREIDTGNALVEIPEVQEVHYIAGEDCWFVKLRVSGTKELGHILQEKISTIESVSSTKSSIVLSTMKENAGISLNETDLLDYKENNDR